MPVETDCQDCRLRNRPLFVAMKRDEIAYLRRLIWAGTVCGRSDDPLSGRKVPS